MERWGYKQFFSYAARICGRGSLLKLVRKGLLIKHYQLHSEISSKQATANKMVYFRLDIDCA